MSLNFNRLIYSLLLKYRFVDLRQTTDNPLEALQIAAGKSFLIDIDLQKWRHVIPLGSGCTSFDQNPFIETLKLYGRDLCKQYELSPLYDYYGSWQPSSMAEAMGLDLVQASSTLRALKPYTIIFPWRAAKLDKLSARSNKRINSKPMLSAKKAADIDEPLHGIIGWGPVSKSFGDAEFYRLTRLYDSIRLNGFRTPNARDPFRTYLLIRDQEFRVMPRSGKHRLSAVAALGYDRVPVLMGPNNQVVLVSRRDADSWPHVRSGLFQLDEAISVFDNIFEGRIPFQK